MQARVVLPALLLALAANSALAAGRDLLQSGVSCPNQIPACTARRCTTRILDSKETYVCLRCQRGYVPVKGSDGKSVVQCVCPPGTYQYTNTTGSRSVTSCVNCPTGSYCPGGNPKARRPTDNIGGEEKSCNPPNSSGLTTKSTRSTRPADCIAEPGYVLPARFGSRAVACTGSTYAPPNNRLKTCLPCQSGLAIPEDWPANRTQSNRMDVCQVPPGKFWELNVVRDCPMGLYRESYVRTDNKLSIACLSCPEGWTTAQIGTVALRFCNVLLPGYQIANISSNGTNSTINTNTTDPDWTPPPTEGCPIGYYKSATDSGFFCKRCPFGATTLKNSSTSIDDCVVPPGYYVRNVSGDAEMVKCPTTPDGTEDEGYYRPGWKVYKEVISPAGDGKDICVKCGDGIMSRAIEFDELPTAPTDSKVPATSASCFIIGGWGITFDPEDYSKFKAIKPCPANTYGVAGETFGLINAPCKACTKNLYSPAASDSFDDCKNPGGFGYTSEGANQCPDGFWAAKDSMAPCEQCPPGRTTLYQPGNGTLQDSIEDCFVEPGNGVFDGNSTDPWNPSNSTNSTTPAQPCPQGYFSAGGFGNVKCEKCPDTTSTLSTGSTTCDGCAPGFGKASATSECVACTFGQYSGGHGDSCMSCPNTVFNDFVGDGYTSIGITFKEGLTDDVYCVPRFAQVPKPVGDRMGLPDSMLTETVDVSGAANDNAAVKTCVESCTPGTCCIAQMEKLRAGGLSCKQARLTPVATEVGSGKAALFYKLPPSQFAAASVGDDEDPLTIEAKTIGSGVFAACDITTYKTDALDGFIGTSPNPELVEAGRNATEWNTAECSSIASCKEACLKTSTCWGFIGVDTAQGVKFALRGGESWLDGRSFFVSPLASDAAAVTATPGLVAAVGTWYSNP